MVTYPVSSYKENMISINQLFLKDLGIDGEASNATKKPEVEAAILHTMCFDPQVIFPLTKCGIPVTLFKEGSEF